MVSATVNFDTFNTTTFQQEITALELSVPAVPAPDKAYSGKADKEWTVMVYVNAKNNLEKYGLLDVNEMEMVGSTDKVNVVAELGRINGYDSSDGNWIASRRYLVTKDSNMSKVASPVVQDLGKVDMGDYRHLIEFANWAKANYPAKRYMLIVWNHGSGWDKNGRVRLEKGISYDDETGNHITTPQLGMALKAIGKTDVYGSDACLMQMPEVIYEIKDNVTYVVGSEETEPGDGYTYNDLLGPLVAKPAMGAEELGKLAVNAYANHYSGQEHTQSLVKAAAMGQFLSLMNEFADAMVASGEKVEVKAAISATQSYAVSDNRDISHFAQLIGASTKNATVKAKAAAVDSYIKNTLVVLNRQYAYNNSFGIAGYMPGYYYNGDYNSLAWAAASKWDEFIGWYLKKD
ncbi:MAG: hypothetical protein A2234_03945 [Elusimicrobia bacterium RIFOXYA2_FULL_58_8]|nr:MAG: hypothetical protein A2285_03065 [Elusimicrobia bacterium RIFOXYA12_FULL_57_11]OGS13549.1 MAG: hypothetical protein A2234_03945 [Elusimicrobia bacterium RIFOXYA2_FULL_58_8]